MASSPNATMPPGHPRDTDVASALDALSRGRADIDMQHLCAPTHSVLGRRREDDVCVLEALTGLKLQFGSSSSSSPAMSSGVAAKGTVRLDTVLLYEMAWHAQFFADIDGENLFSLKQRVDK